MYLSPSSADGSEGVVITFAAYEYHRRFFEPLMDTFHEQNPEITVQFVDLSQSFSEDQDWSQLTYERILAQAADTVMIQGPFYKDMTRYFRDLRPLYESDPTFQPEDFWSGILTACEDSYGNMVGMPMTATINGIFYDEAAFDAAGVPHPKPGWTWDDFQKAVTAIADKQGNQVKYGFYDQPGLYGSILAPVVSDHLRLRGGEVDAAALLNEVQWYVDLARAEMLSGLKSEEEMMNEWEQRMKLFEDDALRPAMWIDSLISYLPTSYVEYDPGNPFAGTSIDRFGFAPFPVSADGSSTQTSRSWVECAAVSSGSTNPRATWAWLNFISNYWFVMDTTQVYEISRAPARQSVAEANDYWNLLPAKAVPAVRYALEHGSYDFTYMELFGDISLALAKTISENTDFERALETAIAARPATPTPPADNSPIVVATPFAPLPEGVTAIKYYFNQMNPNELSAVKILVEQFNQRSPDTQIRLLTDYHGSPEEDWISSMANNFDCFTASPPYWQGFSASRLLNLSTLMSNEPVSFSGDFYPEMLDKFRSEGNLYALPASSQVQMLAYNADLLARRGLPIPDNDWTFEDFMELATAAASTSEADPSFGFMYTPYDEFLFLGKGLKWADFTANPPQVFLDSPEMVDYLKWLVKMEQENVLFNQDNSWEKMEAIVRNGQLAFWPAMMGEKTMWFYGPGQEPPYKIGMAPFPEASADSPIVTWSNDRGHYISAQSQDPRVCWEWTKFLSEQPNLFAGVPARRSVAESPAWEATVGREDAAAYRAALAKARPVDTAAVDIDMEVQQIIWPATNWRTQAIRAVLEGQEPKSVLIVQQQKVETYLACALALDDSKAFEQRINDIQACIQQADPEGSW
jgi:ABC-type glycerol-3-phosphate transport system substrate-binding protein